MKTQKFGAPKKYKEKTKILHTLEFETLHELDRHADYCRTRTDIINQAINEWLLKQ